MDSAIEDALTTWFEAEQIVRNAPWQFAVGDQRRAEHAAALLRLEASANALHASVTRYTSRPSELIGRTTGRSTIG